MSNSLRIGSSLHNKDALQWELLAVTVPMMPFVFLHWARDC